MSTTSPAPTRTADDAPAAIESELPPTRVYRIYLASDLDKISFRSQEGTSITEAVKAEANTPDGLPNDSYVILAESAVRPRPIYSRRETQVIFG